MKLSLRFSNPERARRVIARAVACGAFLILPGCFIPSLRPTKTGVALPASYDGVPGGLTNGTFGGSASPDNSAQLRADQFYNDPVLLQLICQAVATNRELRILEEEVQVARAATFSTRGAFLPLVGFQADVGTRRYSKYTLEGASRQDDPYLRNPDVFLPNPVPNYFLGFNFLVPLDIWRALRNARDAAVQRYLAAIERRNAFVTRMVADIAENYYGLMALDQRLQTLDRIIAFQQRSLEVARALFKGGREASLAVQRFEAEVLKNQSEKLIVRQQIVETENRINFLAGRPPQPVERDASGFFNLTIHPLSVGVPAQLLLNRPDIRQAERELIAAGLDVQVARAQFFPRVDITGNVGYQAFNPKFLFNPQSLVYNAVGELAAPVLNKAAIRAAYLAANARQLESVYNYQRVILNAVVEVVNRLSLVQNYSQSLALKRQQLQALEAAVDSASKLFKAGRLDYLQVLLAQRDLLTALTTVIETKQQQLSGIVNVYQALGGGYAVWCPPPDGHGNASAPPPPEGPQLLPAPRKEMEPPERPPLPEDKPLPPPGKEQNPPAPPRLPDPQPPSGPGKPKGAP